jgi:C-terminal processing protease CtpA/Prc
LTDQNFAFIKEKVFMYLDRKERRKVLRSFKRKEPFVTLSKNDLQLVYEQKDIPSTPKKVILFIDSENSGAVERFVYFCQQSSRCVLIGKKTAGSLGVEQMITVQSPDARYSLNYALSQNRWALTSPYHTSGIQPDYTIPDSITHYSWVKYFFQSIYSAP